ncbi:MAG: hypothetical protein JO144_01170, partial [Actinobacteria bacterium]|nr:hypothetical protein [Actinomycetota bacterium]
MVSPFSRVFSRSARGPLAPAHKRPHRPPTLEALEERTLLTGAWTPLANLPPSPDGIGTMMLLSDGTVMAEGGGVDNTWYQLTPDATGSYVNGTWSPLASMNIQRLYFGSAVLPDARVFVVGGEYSSDGGFSRTGEIYDPVANTWTRTANFPQTMFGDDPTEVLPDGRVLAGYVVGPQTYIYDPAADTWTPTGTKLNNDQSDEETWVKLPDNSILTYDIFAPGTAQRYLPDSGTWVATGPAPTNLSSSGVGEELGPAFLLPDGRVFYIGATGHTAYYTPSTDSWASGPDVPGGLGADDAPGAELPNGKILFAADHPLFNGPTSVFEFDPSTDTYTNVTPNISGMSETRASYFDRMVVLPTGQVLYTTSDDQLAVYTPDGTAVAAAKPVISNIQANPDGTYTLTGSQLNGIDEGSTYGDDALNATNYPIVQLTANDGTVVYARTYDWNATGVGATNGATSVQFALPFGITPTSYSVSVIANGVASDPVNLVAGAGPAVVRSVPNGNNEPGISSIRFTFNETIIPRTFEDTAKSIDSFTDPNGNPIAVTSVTPVQGTHDRQFDVSFATQVQAGTYTMVIGPNIKDLMHRQMDQDGDGVAGQPDDSYTATFTITNPQVTAYSPTGNNNLPGSIQSVRFTFSRPIDPNSFGTAQVDSFTDPSGNPIAVNAVTPVSGTNNTQY